MNEMGNRFSEPGPRRFAAWVAFIGGLVVAVVVAFFIGRASAPEAEPGSPDRVASPLPQETINGVPVGYARSEAGAVEAATTFSRVMASASGDLNRYLGALRAMAAPDWVLEAEKLAENGFEFLRDRYGSAGSLTFVPVRYRIEAYSDSAATIQIWGVTVASGPKVPGIDESWLTGTVQLVWIEGDWRVAGQSSETGPTPELLQTGSALTKEDLEGFQELLDAP